MTSFYIPTFVRGMSTMPWSTQVSRFPLWIGYVARFVRHPSQTCRGWDPRSRYLPPRIHYLRTRKLDFHTSRMDWRIQKGDLPGGEFQTHHCGHPSHHLQLQFCRLQRADRVHSSPSTDRRQWYHCLYPLHNFLRQLLLLILKSSFSLGAKDMIHWIFDTCCLLEPRAITNSIFIRSKFNRNNEKRLVFL